MVNVRLSAKRQDHLVKYNPFQPIALADSTLTVNDVNFHIPTIVEEVKHLSKKKLTQYKKDAMAFLATASTFLVFPLTSMANTNTSTSFSIPVSGIPQTAEGMSPEIMKLLIGVLGTIVVGGVILAMILLAGVGVANMFGMKNTSKWTMNILKGLTQVLVAPSVVFVIYYFSNLVFGKSAWHISPF
jgi:hypothetical protein